MTMRAGMTGALAVLALTMAVPAGGMQQGGLGNQDPMGPPVLPANQGGMPGNGTSSGTSRSGRTQSPVMQDDVPNPLAKTPQQQIQAQNAARQKEIVKDTDKLLDLALELKSDVNKANKDTLSLDVIKKADEIERLAHSVKEKMRN